MVRRTTSLTTALGIALVVMVVVILLSFVSGLRQSLELAGEPGHWIVLSRGTWSEGESYIPRQQADILRTRPEIATDSSGAALFSPEMVVPFNAAVNRPAIQFRPASLRGVSPVAYRMRRGLKLVAGRWPAPGRDEMAIGQKQAARFPELGVGTSLQIRPPQLDDSRNFCRSRQRTGVRILDGHRRAAAGCPIREWVFVISRRAEARLRGQLSKRAQRRCATDGRRTKRAGFLCGAGQGRRPAARVGADRRVDCRNGRGLRRHEHDVRRGRPAHAGSGSAADAGLQPRLGADEFYRRKRDSCGWPAASLAIFWRYCWASRLVSITGS